TQHKKELHEKYGVIKIGLFGSYARDEQTEDSDIDIAVEIVKERKNIHTFLNLKREMEKAFEKKVDLGIESTLKPLAKIYIANEIIYV
ncbi:MAG: nucleotidyltransferase family protein, partial [Epsilonproteobacteria bacterium]|nr:nucleotidyltransferase family protein [Campylobacterota bacterium]